GHLETGVYPVEAVDATGTGDAFVSGYVFGLLRGANTAECLRLGTAMGASCVRSMGATTTVFSAGELQAFVETHPLTVRTG
ncbi:MAG: carbohydrate kinase family protein, partial [Candidatus Saccharimonas sp.]|nr:carbohydrate kinase family protein [Planctomycetaceae bacterium]